MAELNVEMLKERLYKVSSALFRIGETCVEVSKQHISEEKALNKIRGYLNDAGMWSRFEVDKLIKDCMESTNYIDDSSCMVNNIEGRAFIVGERKPGTEPTEEEKRANAKRIAEAIANVRKYTKRV